MRICQIYRISILNMKFWIFNRQRDKAENIYSNAKNNWDKTIEEGKYVEIIHAMWRLQNRPSLVKTLFKTFGNEFFLAGFFKWVQDILVLFTPVLLKMQISYLGSDTKDIVWVLCESDKK